MSTEKAQSRIYRKRLRAEQEEATRQRITEAAVTLHGSIGPARTTISAIAAEAGVQRATVYRHFPELEGLFMACSALWASRNPPPDPASWAAVADPDERLRHALGELYDWYHWAEPMITNVSRDGPLVPASARASAMFAEHFAALHAALMDGRHASGRPGVRVGAAIGHALDFQSWRSLVGDGDLKAAEAVDLMAALVDAAAL
jgi:AcrR family transcriptional regulator